MNSNPHRASRAAAAGAGKASRHWWLQRISALALIPLTLWFVFTILGHVGDSHRAAAAWVARPGVAAALIAYLAVMFYHAQLGLQVIVEDYVSAQKARDMTLLATRVVNSLAGAAAVGAVLYIAW
ncbi:MAG: succinate dehydrogenase, hydrophobic membrane anchor protein [Gammaproteobacteria bacterium]|nr:succinate dehydrogenase, hydrophobic membrane anchor protein [Gammaproteobacteria bacterium]MDD9875213.1 succinate dehydrogenase, hydrophobic membrane anchor protein [Gammaproteobacteria bacterium]